MIEWLRPIWCAIHRKRYSMHGLSLFKTIYANFKLFPFKTAIQLPLFVYSGTSIFKLGKIDIESDNIFTGMIVWGKYGYKCDGKGKLNNFGRIIFRGPVILGGGTILENTGTIIFEGDSQVGEGGLFLIRDLLHIGRYTRIGFLCFFMDSDDHYMISVEKKIVHKNTAPIIIGDYNWIAAKTTVKKGAITPPFTIVASGNSLVAKDYSDIGSYCVIGGIPAKVIGQGVRRIYNVKEELRLCEYFKSHPEIQLLNLEICDKDLDKYCLDNAILL